MIATSELTPVSDEAATCLFLGKRSDSSTETCELLTEMGAHH